MCRVYIDGVQLLSDEVDDAELEILGSDSGFTLGNPQAVRQTVDALLRNDQIVSTVGWTGREITIPVKIKSEIAGGRADAAARVHRVLQNPRKVSLLPCDEHGAEAWWRVAWAEMEHVYDDFAAKYNQYQLYNITLGVDAWAKSVETFTASATVSGSDRYVWSALNVPGSAPFTGDITVTNAGAGCMVYTPGSIMADHPSYNPAVPALADMPEGTYHLIVDTFTYSGSTVTWSVAGQSGSVTMSTLPYSGAGYACLANDIYISPYSGSGALLINGAGYTAGRAFLLWAGNPMTGQSASYTMLGNPGLGDAPTFKVVAPTPERPIPSQTVNGVQASSALRAVGGDHRTDPGSSMILAAWPTGVSITGASVSVSGYPAFHTEVVPSSRW